MKSEAHKLNHAAVASETLPEEPEVGGRLSPVTVCVCEYCGSRNNVPDGQDYFTCWNCGTFVCRYN